LFQQECRDHTTAKFAKRQRDALAKALNGIVAWFRRSLRFSIPRWCADFQKQTAAHRTRMQQDLQWRGAAEGGSAIEYP